MWLPLVTTLLCGSMVTYLLGTQVSLTNAFSHCLFLPYFLPSIAFHVLYLPSSSISFPFSLSSSIFLLVSSFHLPFSIFHLSSSFPPSLLSSSIALPFYLLSFIISLFLSIFLSPSSISFPPSHLRPSIFCLVTFFHLEAKQATERGWKRGSDSGGGMFWFNSPFLKASKSKKGNAGEGRFLPSLPGRGTKTWSDWLTLAIGMWTTEWHELRGKSCARGVIESQMISHMEVSIIKDENNNEYAAKSTTKWRNIQRNAIAT